MAGEPLLAVRDLRVDFGRRRAPALRGIDFDLRAGQRLGLIGESGSGKSVTALALMGLLPETAHVGGSIRWEGTELVGMSDGEYTKLRGDAMSMIFQEPMTALDPTMRVGRQVAEALRLHGGAPAGKARERVLEMLGEVGLPDARRVADSFPHQLSGGQRQRSLTAMALINRPRLVICDEPTTALDVTVQARVLEVLNAELRAVNAACLFISHDLAVVSQVCDDLIVMYRGELVEAGPLAQVLGNPQHPYTRGLIATAAISAVPPGQRLPEIEDFWNPDDGWNHHE
ncbi:ABC transporter ATP-binding protein [Propionibacterium freudenreichii]|uniref:ABC transporter ATP-binding protein n=1 Tax=Propionibacterium freudenreichii TaxID=1744 RepID=UPI0005428217|nr:ABC transporter ATP-binding protein [Propionibacterium freudenreichii]WBF60643.1 ABC transporter ATP-binding protein [Propionibacterium freudenreichii]WBF64889.1 ABC transporter ATP-binding protein [Propionibacterium freudenreichii]CEH10009.1 ATP-binding ABC transporter protein [Propionibacterium freudenreichii]SBN43732.1 Oligopeptide transport protein of the ABC superfamily, ATP-binding component [Propionibacterium freudenreichii]SBW76933.1 Oligopeptide transport protein of the ABC superfa